MERNTQAQIRHVYEEWHQAIINRDLDRLTDLYGADSTFESPAVYALNGKSDGVLHGPSEIRSFFGIFFRKLDKDVAQWFRSGEFFSNGELLIWEYPRETPCGDQTDLVESMDLEGGLIRRHRVYWGWIGFKAILGALGEPT